MNQTQYNGAGLIQPSRPFAQTTGYDFNTQNKVGKAGELAIDHWLQFLGYGINDVSEVPEYQKAGIDRLLTRPDSSIAKAEYKTDLKAKQTGNLFFEIVSVEHRNIIGWGLTSQADLWIFLIPRQEILVVEPGKFRWLVLEHLAILEKKTVQNQGYCTIGLPVPLADVRKIARHGYKFPDIPF
ncbi:MULTISPECIES: hypothetical protein [unclassified Coleofasciculus]|uniref:hypothetical protein n=1 Tax=Cyanophyceae TaxID=3028117 RepID=UPI0018EFA43C|nr:MULTISPECIES: hypothetical protein [unclassified Coleofasciculus]